MRRLIVAVRMQLIKLCATGLFIAIFASSASAAIVNGDFETGDFTGWTVSAIDDLGGPIDPTPFLSVANVGGNYVADFRTGAFSDGLFIATLEQTFTVDAAAPIVRFDFTLPTVSTDSTGTGTSPFFDAILVSMDDGIDFYELLLVDQFGALADPFGTAPGTVILGAPSDPSFDYGFTANVSTLANQNVTLYVDVINEDDGSMATMTADNFNTGTAHAPVPEPASVAVWSLLTMVGVAYGWRRKRRA